MLHSITTNQRRGYDPPMSFQRYRAANGKSVSRFRTTTGVTAYVADEIPAEALIAWRADLAARLGVPEREEDQNVPADPAGSRDGRSG